MFPDTFTPFIVISLLSLLISSFFSAVKIIFSLTDKNSFAFSSGRIRYYIEKIQAILNDRQLLNATVSFWKTVTNTVFTAFSLPIVYYLLAEEHFLKAALTASLFSIVTLTLFGYLVPRITAYKFYSSLFIPSYIVYGFFSNAALFFPSLITGLQNLMLRLLKYDDKFSFLKQNDKSGVSEDPTEENSGLDREEKRMIRNIFEIGDTSVKEIMVPRINIEALDVGTDFNEALAFIKNAGHSRIPVYKENIDSIIGILYAKDILGWISDNPGVNANLHSILKKPLFIPSTKMIDDLMAEFKKKQVHIAIVVDEYGGTAGIVTMEDILEEIVGEIQDEYDTEEEPVVKISDNVYQVDPHIELDDLVEKLHLHFDLECEEYNTLSGLFYNEYGDIPNENTEFDFNGLKLKVIKMNNQRIEKLQVEIIDNNGEQASG